MLFLVAFLALLLFESVGAANSFANSTISKPATLSSTSTQSCLYPITVSPYFVYNDCDRPGDPELPNTGNPYEGILLEYSDTIIASQCSSSWDSSFSSWLATAPITTQISTFSAGLYEYLDYEPYTSVLTTSTWVHFDGDFSYKADAPCCYNCSLYGGDVQVYYWPTPAPTPGVTKLVDSVNNFTFTSPSVYVVFNSLYATNLCGHVGKDISVTTLVFDPGQLSTALAYTQIGVGEGAYFPFTQASFGAEPTTCGIVTSSFEGFYILSDGSIITSYSGEPPTTVEAYCESDIGNCVSAQWTVVYDPCSPTLSVPSQLFTLNPEWKTCVQGIDAFFDPPYTLTQGGTLVAFSTTADPVSSPSAKPQIKPSAPTPTSTASPSSSHTLDPPPVDPSSRSSPSADPSPSDPSPSADPSPNQVTTAPQGQPQAQPQPTPGASPADPDDPDQTPITTLIPFVAGTQTITPGSPAIIISGTTYSVQSSGGAVIIDNSITLPQAGQSSSDPILTYVLGSQTLVAGGAVITVSSSIILSLLSGGQSVVVEGSSTETLAVTAVFASMEGVVATTTASSGLGGVIISIGGFNIPTSTSLAGNGTAVFTGITFEGRASRLRGAERWDVWIIAYVIIMLGILVL